MKNKKTIAIIAVTVILLILIGLIFFLMNRKYTVTFETSAGVEAGKQVIKKDETVKEPKEPTKDGYTFAGWYYADDENKEFDFSTKVDKDITLIAKWVKGEDKISKISIVSGRSELNIGDELELNLRITPGNASTEGKEIKWSSSDESVVTVDSNGKIKALKDGKATITVEIDGIKSTVEINVDKEEEETEQETESKNIKKEEKSNSEKNNNTSKETKSEETKPEETKPEETKPEETKPEETKPEETKPEETKPEETKPTVTYTHEWGEKLPNDIAGQYYLYIVSSEGKRVSGTATITYKTKNGTKSKTESIPAKGLAIVKNTVVSISNEKAN